MKDRFKIKNNSILALIYIYMTSAFYVLRNSNLYFNGMKIVLGVAVICGLLYFILSSRCQKQYRGWIIALLACSLIPLMRGSGKDTRMLVAFVAVLVGMNMERKELLKALLKSKIFFFLLAMLSGGIGHINGVAMQVGFITLIYISLSDTKITHGRLIMLWATYLICAVYTYSGSYIICIGLALCLVSTKKCSIIRSFLQSFLAKNIYPFALLINLFSALWIGERYFPFFRKTVVPGFREGLTYLLEKVDMFTSSRLTLASESLYRYGISLLGGNVQYDSIINEYGIYFNLDSGMIWLIQGMGIITTIVFIVLMTIMMKWLVKNREYNLIIVAISVALWAMNEDMMISIGVNFMYFILGEALSHKTSNQQVRELYEYT